MAAVVTELAAKPAGQRTGATRRRRTVVAAATLGAATGAGLVEVTIRFGYLWGALSGAALGAAAPDPPARRGDMDDQCRGRLRRPCRGVGRHLNAAVSQSPPGPRGCAPTARADP